MDTLEKNLIVLKNFLRAEDISIFGTTNTSNVANTFIELPEKIENKLPVAISIGMRLSKAVVDSLVDKPTKLYFHHYRQINNLLDKLATKLVAKIQNEGFEALPIPASQTVDWEKQRGHLSHKSVAVHAGIGWLGINNLVVHPIYGSQVRYITVLTNFPLPQNEKIQPSLCNHCLKCISSCPANAIKENIKNFDRISCLNKLIHFSKQYNIGHYICGLCVKACSGLKKTS